MNITRRKPSKNLISLVSMIDVLLIMLVFFMVTSTYINLDMIPMVERADEPINEQPTALDTNSETTLLIRLSSQGDVIIQGQKQTNKSLTELFSNRPSTPVLILPSRHASSQSLVSLMDSITMAGISNIRIVQLEAKE